MPISSDSQKRAARAEDKEERARDRVIAMHEYEARQIATRENMARLRALRLAKEANEKPIAKPKTRRSKSAGFAS
jgi:predicted ABC-class ATPase